MSDPVLSVVMPVYNAGRYVRMAIDSVLNQTYTDFELILINDGSTDDSQDVLNGFSDHRIRILSNKQNQGIVYARNRGLSEARGKYIAPFDADDVARKDKFEKQIRFLEENPQYGLIGSWAYLIDAEGNKLKKKWKINAAPERIPCILLFRNYLLQSAVVMRREVIPQGGYVKGLDAVEDYRMWASIARNHLVWNYPEYLVNYRIHPEGVTTRAKTDARAREEMILRYLYKPLGIDLSKEEIDLILWIRNPAPANNPDMLKHTEHFLLKLLKANLVAGVFDQGQLQKEVSNRWLKICRHVACYTRPGLVYRCLSSPLLFRPFL